MVSTTKINAVHVNQTGEETQRGNAHHQKLVADKC
jgi:hypothetical protein